MSKTTVEVSKVEYNGAPPRAGDRGGPVEVLHNSETGRTEPLVQGGGGRPSRTAVIEAAKARAAQRPPAPPAAEAVATTAGDDDEVVGSGPAGDEAPAAETAEAESVPEGEQPAAAEPAESPESPEPAAAATADPGVELERVQAQLEEMRREREQEQVGDLDSFIEDPIASLRTWVGKQLGVPADHEAVTDSLSHLSEELTWGQIPAQDLPSDKKAQLDMARWSRQTRLQTHRRKADQGKRTRDDLEKRARTQAERSYAAIRDNHPNLALAAEIDGRDVPDVINATLVRAMQAGLIKPDAPVDAAYQEAIRLAEIQSQQSLTRKAKLLAHLAPAPAPIKPGASSKTKATAQQPTSPAASKTPSPRALTAAKAGAAPSRPAEPAPSQPKRKVVDASTYDDPSDRRQEVLKRHQRRP